jgi:hypothetical protein
MSDDRTTDERFLGILDQIMDTQLAQLLEDVGRIAEGVGAIRELAVTIAPHVTAYPRPAPLPLTPAELQALHEMYDRATRMKWDLVMVPPVYLRRVLEAAGVRPPTL